MMDFDGELLSQAPTEGDIVEGGDPSEGPF